MWRLCVCFLRLRNIVLRWWLEMTVQYVQQIFCCKFLGFDSRQFCYYFCCICCIYWFLNSCPHCRLAFFLFLLVISVILQYFHAVWSRDKKTFCNRFLNNMWISEYFIPLVLHFKKLWIQKVIWLLFQVIAILSCPTWCRCECASCLLISNFFQYKIYSLEMGIEPN